MLWSKKKQETGVQEVCPWSCDARGKCACTSCSRLNALSGCCCCCYYYFAFYPGRVQCSIFQVFWAPPPLLTSPPDDMWVYGGSLCPCDGVLGILRSIQSVLDLCWLLLPGRVTVGCAGSIWPFGRSGTIAPVSKSSLMLSLSSNIEALLSCHCLLEDNYLRYQGALPTINRQMELRTWVHVYLTHYLHSILLVCTC